MKRRDFLKTGCQGAVGAGLALGVAPALFAQRMPAARTRLAIIGFGAQGVRLAGMAAAGGALGVEIVAVADLYDGRLLRAKELLGEKLETTRDYRTILDRKDVDAVVIATPDHWHAALCREAAAAGKDVYCETPVTHALDEGAAIQTAVDGAKRVVQVGGAWINSPLFDRAREIINSGKLGTVTLVSGAWDTASAIDAWQFPFPPDASPESVDFKTFLGAAPARDFDLHRFFRWQRYWDYGTGLAGERFVPQLTAIHWLLGCGAPVRASASGGIQRWKDGRQVPDVFAASFDYSEGFTVNLTASQAGGRRPRELQVVGTDGTMTIDFRQLKVYPEPVLEPYTDVGEAWPKNYRDWFYMMHGLGNQGQPRTPEMVQVSERYELPEGVGGPAAHLTDFVNSIRSRQQPRESLQLALTAATGAHLANETYRQQRPATATSQA